jgi:hypothetical protein
MLKKYRTHLALLFASFCVSLLLAEGFFTVYALTQHGKIDRKKLIRTRKELRDDVVGGIGDRFENRLILHPLFGYTYNPKDTASTTLAFLENTALTLINADIQSKIAREVSLW